MLRTIASVLVAVTMSLFTVFIVACYWLLLFLLTALRMLLWPLQRLARSLGTSPSG